MNYPSPRSSAAFRRSLARKSPARLGTFVLAAGLLQAARQPGRCLGWGNLLPAEPAPASGYTSNWVTAAAAELLANTFTNGTFDYLQATNTLCAASRQGNLKAQALWAIAVMQGGSPEATTAGLKLLDDTATKGCVPAMVQLGFLYETGRYIRKNYDHALHWFTMAANAGDGNGQAALGGLYHEGLGLRPNFFMAAKFYRLAADQTNYVAMKSLGVLLANGWGVPKDTNEAKYWLLRSANEGSNRRAMYDLGVLCGTNATAEAFHWFQQSANFGDPLAAWEVAHFYYAGWAPGGTNLASARYWRLQAATWGSTAAEYEMGAACRTGDGVPQDPAASLKWLRQAAAKNHPSANYDLAMYYLKDKTHEASARRAHEYMRTAALEGHREAQFQYAMGCFRGDAGVVDGSLGREWLAKSANNGWPRAELFLFQMYFYGRGPALGCPPYPVDKVRAVEWLHQAATHESLVAQSTLAVMQIRGLNIALNPVSAEKLLRHAAARGYAQAQNDLGFAMENGDVSSTNLVEAAIWLSLAKAHPPDSNIARRVEVNLSRALLQLTPAQIDEVNRRVQGFQAIPETPLDPLMPGWEKYPGYQPEDPQY